MAFTLGLMGTLAGQNQQRIANEQEQREAARAQAAAAAAAAQNQQQFDAQIAQRDREDQTTAERDRSLDAKADAQTAILNRQNGVGLPPIPLDLLPPRNATPQQRAEKTFKLADWYERNGATALANTTRLNAQGYATATNAYDRTNIARDTLAEKKREFDAKIEDGDKQLQQRLGNSYKIVMAQVEGRINVAGIDQNGRHAIAVLAGQNAMARAQFIQDHMDTRDQFNQGNANARAQLSQSGQDARANANNANRANIAVSDNDLKAAITQYVQMQDDARRADASSALGPVDTTGVGPAPAYQPPVTVNVNPSAPIQWPSFPSVQNPTNPANPQNPQNPRATSAQVPNQSLPAGGMQAVLGATPTVPPDPRMLSDMRAALKARTSPAHIVNILTTQFHKSPQEAAAIMRSVLGSQGGGLPGAPPFSLTP